MAHLDFCAPSTVGKKFQEQFHFSQSVRIGDRIETSGHGGSNRETGKLPESVSAQIAGAFRNIQGALIDAGGEGWNQVYQVRSYHVNMNLEAAKLMVVCLRKWCPDHKPLWTAVGVDKLAGPGMKVMIEVVAHSEK
ncbi:uncharacterized protein KY384_000354 [Bacidia gigantensis]|uniref:uncharacterized protein n=1 Tax=Bacidia gigantensis TaxID=2732470 RepID=UPI001D04AFC0|nr:uncharacterized protein KY384_000354 [Bacidia gigantensis]KAG8526361.1 hypothetical protein KY384_000354 [Bacidia gigantensis]